MTVRVYPGGVLPPERAAQWLAAGLAEITHAPSGFSGLDAGSLALAAGARGPTGQYRQGPALLVVLAGRLAVEFGPALAERVEAGPGDSVEIPPRVVHRTVALEGPLQLLQLAPDGPAAEVAVPT